MRKSYLGLLLAALAGLAQAGPIVYNLATDWSNASNPNGVWSYNQGNNPLPYSNFSFCCAQQAWDNGGSEPPAWLEVSTSTYVIPDHWEMGDVLGHSTSQSGAPNANVTWTSPEAGTIDIQGKAWDAFHYFDRIDTWRLYVAGSLVAERNPVNGIVKSDPNAQFANNLVPGQSLTGLAVNPGDKVEFEIQALTYYGHFVGVDLTVNYNDAGVVVPEPSTGVLAGLCLGGVLVRVLRRRR